jgi:Domain of unknown function (DUF4136)
VNRRTHLLTLLLAVGLLGGCASSPKVRSDYDQTADFGSFHTFGFVTQPGTEREGYSTLLTRDIENAVTAQMQQRGYVLSENPDLLVNFAGKLQEKQSIQSAPGPYYGYRTYGAWAGYGWGGVYSVNYTEGTLNIDIIDAARKQMVWEGVAVGEVHDKDLSNKQDKVNQVVAEVFAKYPFRAGASTPTEIASK